MGHVPPPRSWLRELDLLLIDARIRSYCVELCILKVLCLCTPFCAFSSGRYKLSFGIQAIAVEVTEFDSNWLYGILKWFIL